MLQQPVTYDRTVLEQDRCMGHHNVCVQQQEVTGILACNLVQN